MNTGVAKYVCRRHVKGKDTLPVFSILSWVVKLLAVKVTTNVNAKSFFLR